MGNLKPVLHHDRTTKTLTFGRKSGGGGSGPNAADPRFFGTRTQECHAGSRTNVVLLLGNCNIATYPRHDVPLGKYVRSRSPTPVSKADMSPMVDLRIGRTTDDYQCVAATATTPY